MTADRLADLSAAGVSIWLDDLDRGRLTSGGLADLVADSFVVGVTTNPSIFEKAIVGGAAAYADQVRDLALRGVDIGAVGVLGTMNIASLQDAGFTKPDTFRVKRSRYHTPSLSLRYHLPCLGESTSYLRRYIS